MVDAVLVAAGLPKLGAQLRRQTDDFFARLRAKAYQHSVALQIDRASSASTHRTSSSVRPRA